MKIIKIEKIEGIYNVTLRPNWFEKIIGRKEKVELIKYTGYTYTFGSGGVYVNKKGETLGNGSYIGESIDNWKRSF